MRRALGKGLAQLLGEQTDNQPNELELSVIFPNPDQPRKVFDEDALQELADSIKLVGLLQPIVVRPIGEDKYQIIAGERRWRASRIAGLETVPVLVRATQDDLTLQLALIENVQREDISSIEAAIAYKKLIDDFEMTQDQVAQKVGKSRVSVSNTLRLLRLPTEVQEAILGNLITEGHARALLMCESEKALQDLFYKIVDEGLSVRESERRARATQAEKPAVAKPKAKAVVHMDPNFVVLEEAISTYFGAPTKIERGAKGGKLQIEYFSEDDLERILEILGIQI